MSKISATIIIEEVNKEAIDKLVKECGAWVREEFQAMRKTAKNYLKFLNKHNLGFIDWDTNEYLSHDCEMVLLRAYLYV